MLNDMSTSGLVEEKNILLVNEKVKKDELIKTLVLKACEGLSAADQKDILERVLKREDGITTTLDNGLSIPHCRAEEVSGFKSALAVIPDGISDPAAGNMDIKVMFLFISPADPAFFQKHLQFLAAVSEKFKENFVNRLVQVKTAAEAAELLK